MMGKEIICVMGGGTMGAGVACAFASKDYPVVIIEKNHDQIKKSQDLVNESLQGQMFFAAEEEKETIQVRCESNISWQVDYNEVKDCQYIIENIIEDVSTKKELYLTLREFANKDAIFIPNTSAIPIAMLGEYVDAPSRMIGIHFMNPVYLKPVAEVIVTPDTSNDTKEKTLCLLKSIGKRGIIVKDKAGFVVNRVLMQTINNAIQVLSEGTATVEDIDDLFINCLGHKMGPLATADLIGLDTIYLTLKVLQEEYGEEQYKPCELLIDYVNEGKLGRKSKIGFYRY